MATSYKNNFTNFDKEMARLVDLAHRNYDDNLETDEEDDVFLDFLDNGLCRSGDPTDFYRSWFYQGYMFALEEMYDTAANYNLIPSSEAKQSFSPKDEYIEPAAERMKDKLAVDASNAMRSYNQACKLPDITTRVKSCDFALGRKFGYKIVSDLLHEQFDEAINRYNNARNEANLMEAL